MFCVECGNAVKEEWTFCNSCGQEVESLVEDVEEESEGDEAYEYACPEQDARAFLNDLEFDHWRAAGMPTLRFIGDHPVGIAFNSESSEWYDFIRFAMHNMEEHTFDLWVENGCRLLSFFDQYEFVPEPDTELLTPFQVGQLMEGENRDTWEAIGRPQMRRRSDGEWFLSSPLNLYRWREATVPISDEEITERLSSKSS